MTHRHRGTGLLLGTSLTLLLVCMLVGQAVAQPCAPLPDGLVSWWPGDGNADDIHGGNDGTLQNGATFEPQGKVGQAFSFDGMNDYVEVPDNPNFHFAGSFSVEAWVKTTRTTGAQTVVQYYDCGGLSGCPNSLYGFVIGNGAPDGFIRDKFGNVNNLAGVASTFVADGSFHHLAWVRDVVAGQVRIYVDGVLAGSTTLVATGPFANEDGEADPLTIGGGTINGQAPPNLDPNLFFNGVIDEVELYNRALSASEIQAIFTAGSAGKCIYNFQGFFPPVDNPPVLNRVNAGRAIPVKFSLGGDQGLSIFALGYPKSQAISCASTVPIDPIEETVTAGGSPLSYDLSTDTYTYVWKTEKAWGATCRQFIMKLKDGSDHRAHFTFQ